MQQIRPSKQLLLVGGGHSHVTVIKQLGMRPIPGVKVTLVTPSLKTAYSGMLPGCIAGHYQASDIYIDLAKLCQAAGIDWVLDEICGVDRTANGNVQSPAKSSIRCLIARRGKHP